MTKRQILSVVLFQLSWWGHYYSAFAHSFNLSLLNLFIFSSAFFLFISENRKHDLFVGLVVSGLGYLMDYFILEGSLFSFPEKSFISTFWLFGMWFAFASSITVSLRSLLNQPKIALPLAAVLGPLSYLAGEKIQVLEYLKPVFLYYLVHGLIWAFIFWILNVLQKRKII